MRKEPFRILLVEDDPDFSFLIQNTLRAQPDLCVVGCTNNPAQAILQAQTRRPDIVLMDLNLTGSQLDGIDAARQIRLCTDAKVLILTAFENEQIITDACKHAFANGYIFKSQASMLLESLRSAAQGATPQEHLIRSLIFAELSPAERTVCDILLGADIHLLSSQKTISNQRKALLKKLGLESPEQLQHLFPPQ